MKKQQQKQQAAIEGVTDALARTIAEAIPASPAPEVVPSLVLPRITEWIKGAAPVFTVVIKANQPLNLAGLQWDTPALMSSAPYKERYEWVKVLVGADLVTGTHTFEFRLTKSQVPIDS